jgi:hypothetical protein
MYIIGERINGKKIFEELKRFEKAKYYGPDACPGARGYVDHTYDHA